MSGPSPRTGDRHTDDGYVLIKMSQELIDTIAILHFGLAEVLQ
jgi:hypothetical protein